MPDRLFVWNEIQRAEAETLHGIPRDRVVVTGAQCFDEWFDWRPRPREEFCAPGRSRPGATLRPLRVLRRPGRASPRSDFVRRWMAALRAARRRARRRRHPRPPAPEAAGGRGSTSTCRRAGRSSIPREGHAPTDPESKADYFDSIYHSAAVVGLNTSAMIEAAIVGRSVLTVLDPEYERVQQGTLHFRYLLEVARTALLQVAHTLEEHVGPARSRRSPERRRRGSGRGVRRRVRPSARPRRRGDADLRRRGRAAGRRCRCRVPSARRRRSGRYAPCLRRWRPAPGGRRRPAVTSGCGSSSSSRSPATCACTGRRSGSSSDGGTPSCCRTTMPTSAATRLPPRSSACRSRARPSAPRRRAAPRAADRAPARSRRLPALPRPAVRRRAIPSSASRQASARAVGTSSPACRTGTPGAGVALRLLLALERRVPSDRRRRAGDRRACAGRGLRHAADRPERAQPTADGHGEGGPQARDPRRVRRRQLGPSDDEGSRQGRARTWRSSGTRSSGATRWICTGSGRSGSSSPARSSSTMVRPCALDRPGGVPARASACLSSPYVLYVGSSPNIAPPEREIEFVRRWLEVLRADAALAGVGVLDPAPPVRRRRLGRSRSRPPGAAVAPRTPPALPMTEADDELYFDSIHHAAAVVGINTSAMVESFIQRKPVLTVRAEEFRDTAGDAALPPSCTAPRGGCVAGRGDARAARRSAPSNTGRSRPGRRRRSRASFVSSSGRSGSTGRRRRSWRTRSSAWLPDAARQALQRLASRTSPLCLYVARSAGSSGIGTRRSPLRSSTASV